jgi:hypothetical protein
MAQDRGYVEMTQLLERTLASLHGASSEGESVAAAIRDPDLALVRRILDGSPQLVNAGDARSNQPIHWAVMTRQIPIIDELLARGADIDARRADGARPIQLTMPASPAPRITTRTPDTRPVRSKGACAGAASRPRPVIVSYTSEAPPAAATRARNRRRVRSILPSR